MIAPKICNMFLRVTLDENIWHLNYWDLDLWMDRKLHTPFFYISALLDDDIEKHQ